MSWRLEILLQIWRRWVCISTATENWFSPSPYHLFRMNNLPLSGQHHGFPLLQPSTFSTQVKLQVLEMGYDDGTDSSGAFSVGKAELLWLPGAQVLPTKMQEGSSWTLGFPILLQWTNALERQDLRASAVVQVSHLLQREIMWGEGISVLLTELFTWEQLPLTYL